MNLLFPQRRMWTMMTVPVMLMVLARFIVIVGAPEARAMSFMPHWHAMPRPHAAVTKPPVVVAPEKAAPVAKVEVANLFSLNSGLREYRYLLSGQVTCGGSPCQAELRLSIQTDHNPDFKQVIKTTPDGYFDYQTVLQENMREPLDWRVMVYTPHTYPVELHERKILTDDNTVEVRRDIALP